MAGNTFGQAFRVTTAGESHGPANVAILDGVPAGIPLTVEDLMADLLRRRPGQSSLVSQRDEPDTPEILSGVFEGKTTGTSLAILIRNQDQRSRDYSEIKDLYRPGHADFTYDAKYGRRDYRGGGRASARETVARVAAGAVAKKIIQAAFGGRVVGYVVQVGDIRAQIADPAAITLEQVEQLLSGEPNLIRCPDYDAAEKMIALIEAVRKEQDSIGGVAEIVATGVPAGLGEPVFDKLKADLAKALFSIPAVMGVETGIGFGCAALRGSACNDVFIALAQKSGVRSQESGEKAEKPKSRKAEIGNTEERTQNSELRTQNFASVTTRTNRHGGILGGISTGLPIVLRAAVKPTSSIPQEQDTVNTRGEPAKIRTKGRHDPCLLPRFVPVAEAMVAIVLADHWLRWKGQYGG